MRSCTSPEGCDGMRQRDTRGSCRTGLRHKHHSSRRRPPTAPPRFDVARRTPARRCDEHVAHRHPDVVMGRRTHVARLPPVDPRDGRPCRPVADSRLTPSPEGVAEFAVRSRALAVPRSPRLPAVPRPRASRPDPDGTGTSDPGWPRRALHRSRDTTVPAVSCNDEGRAPRLPPARCLVMSSATPSSIRPLTSTMSPGLGRLASRLSPRNTGACREHPRPPQGGRGGC